MSKMPGPFRHLPAWVACILCAIRLKNRCPGMWVWGLLSLIEWLVVFVAGILRKRAADHLLDGSGTLRTSPATRENPHVRAFVSASWPAA
jgi:hypothetical protein